MLTLKDKELQPTQPLPIEELCFHCHLPVISKTKHQLNNKNFCCNGCLSVYKILHDAGLEKYYQLSTRDDSGKRLEDYNSSLKFTHFDRGEETEKTFYLEGVHCLACLWLIENSKTCLEGVENVRLNMSNSQVTVKIKDKGSFSSVAQWFNQLGYFPHLLKDEEEGQKLFKKENYVMLKRIGVAGFSTGNIMLLAVSIYGGADAKFFSIFSWLSALIYLPTFLYSAQPFFSNALHKFRAKQISLDIPVAITIILGSLISYINVFRASSHFYFDSLSAFIFLLLSARFFLKRIQQNHASTQNVQDLFESSECLKKLGEDYHLVSIKDIKAGDIIRLKSGETVPLDLELINEKACFNTALISGEHLPKLLQKGEMVLAGSVIMSGEIEGLVKGTLKDSQLGKILNSVESSWLENGNEVQFADKLATQLLNFAFLLCTIIVSYFSFKGQWEIGMERAMAVLIVTCPCALGLGTPLAYIQGLKSLFRKKIVVKNGEILKKISEVQNIYFDKTGTITKGTYSVVKVEGTLNPKSASKIWALESFSTHPVAFSLRRYLEDNYPLDLTLKAESVKEELGSGIHGIIENNKWKVVKSENSNADVEVFCDDEKMAAFYFDDPLKEESSRTLDWFKLQKIKTYLLTGDHRENAERVMTNLGFQFDQLFADQLPSKKAQTLNHTTNNMMVGDGYNDVVAFEKASVGVALGQKVDLQLKNADVFIPSGRLDDLTLLFKGAFNTQKTINRNILFSVFYNLIGILGSVMGLISPLGAAVLMPLSSITILLSTVLGRNNR
ncbi:MAG: heavy metal translocating P-type ATPase [Proteobacteria bacterium]|nr:heavy metal translocating P-type ATPase [Pseudomonadota bacterium]